MVTGILMSGLFSCTDNDELVKKNTELNTNEVKACCGEEEDIPPPPPKKKKG